MFIMNDMIYRRTKHFLTFIVTRFIKWKHDDLNIPDIISSKCFLIKDISKEKKSQGGNELIFMYLV